MRTEYMNCLDGGGGQSSKLLPKSPSSDSQNISHFVKGPLIPFNTALIFFGAGSPIWLSEVEQRISEFKSLKSNWDSYGAEPVTEELCSKALKLLTSIKKENLPKPFLSPTPDGGIDIEWNKQSCLLSIKVRKNEIRSLLFNRDNTPNEKEKISDINYVNELISKWEK